jgi:hypothetical protein
MTSWVILLTVAVWTLGALTVMALLWAHAARRMEPPEDYRA